MPTVDGHEITITNPDKILFPDDGITKGDLGDYYGRMAERMLPLVRPGSLSPTALLESLGFVPFVKTTGSRGLHVVVPITVGPTFEEAQLFADSLGQRLAAGDPNHLTTEFIKESRKGRLFIDINRNAYAQPAVAPYALRARRAAP